MRPPGAEKDWGIMKNSGMSETMQTLMRKSVCALLSLLLLLSAVLPVKAAAETAPVKVVRVGSFEDTFNYCNEKGARKGYGYELLQTLSGYTGWQFEYVTCDWADCFEKLENGEIDIMGGISYTEDRAEEMLFSDEPMGEEKYYLYADLSRADISASNLKTLDGKKIGVVMGTEPEVMLTEWEEKHGIKTQHVNISNNEDVKQKLANTKHNHRIPKTVSGIMPAIANAIHKIFIPPANSGSMRKKTFFRKTLGLLVHAFNSSSSAAFPL